MKTIILIFLVAVEFSLSRRHFLTIVYHRHGARNPISLYNSEIFEGGEGVLTAKGYQQMQALGKDIKKRLNLYLERTIKPSEAIFLASPVPRTQESALGFIETFFSSNENWELVPVSSLSDLICLENENRCIFYLESKEKDFLFHGGKENVCKKNKNLIKAIMGTKRYKKTLRKYQRTLFVDIAKKFNSEYGTKFDILNVKWSDFSHMHDVLYCASFLEYSKTKRIPKFDYSTMEQIRKLKFYQQFIARFGKNPTRLSKNTANAFFSTIKRLVKKKLNGDLFDLKYAHFSGHDVNMAGILTELVNMDEFSGREDAFIPFASNLEISLFVKEENDVDWSDKNSILENMEVHLFYNGDEIQSQINKESKLPWNQFLKLLKSKSERKFLEYCQSGKTFLRGKF